MMGSPRLWLRGGSGGWPATAVAAVFALVAMMAAVPAAQAQVVGPPVGLPPPIPTPTMVNADISTGATALNLGSTFLERLGNQASGFDRIWRNNPGGGGASEATDPPRLRTWAELYGVSLSTSAQADFAGDKRRTLGGVAGFGATLTPGFNIGFSVDQSRTDIDVPLVLQSATLDLTQFGFSPHFSHGQFLFDERVLDWRKTMRTVAPKALIAIWF
jgi:Autotransporter beta-domain